MAESQNIIGIVYDYDQTLSPEYMQDDVLFPAFGIKPESFWEKCGELVDDEGYDNELAYMKALLDYLSCQVGPAGTFLAKPHTVVAHRALGNFEFLRL